MAVADGNGFRIKGWKDVLTVISLTILVVSLIASAVLWGVLIDLRGEAHAERIRALETEIDELRRLHGR